MHLESVLTWLGDAFQINKTIAQTNASNRQMLSNHWLQATKGNTGMDSKALLQHKQHRILSGGEQLTTAELSTKLNTLTTLEPQQCHTRAEQMKTVLVTIRQRLHVVP